MASTIFHGCCVALLFGVASVACTHVPLRSPEQGGAHWTELTSKHLVLSTDIEAGRAREMLAQFERTYDALGSMIPHPPVDPAGRIDLVVFDDRRDFLALSGEKKSTGAYFQNHPSGDLEAHPVMVMTEDVLASGNQATFLHELTHRFVRENIPRVPTWLNETKQWSSRSEPSQRTRRAGAVRRRYRTCSPRRGCSTKRSWPTSARAPSCPKALPALRWRSSTAP